MSHSDLRHVYSISISDLAPNTLAPGELATGVRQDPTT